jgi:hypothetical protein
VPPLPRAGVRRPCRAGQVDTEGWARLPLAAAVSLTVPSQTATFEFDAAISFLQADLPFALELRESLSPALQVFVYSRNQETVAATDGMETFRTVFLDRARLSVVLFRRGWGSTPWTAVEEAAIRDRCLHTRYRSLVLVNLDGSEPPSWVPETYQYFDRTQYSADELVGVIKARAQEMGAELRVPSVADRAEAIERQRVFDAETAQLLDNSAMEWDAACETLMNMIREEAAAVAARAGWAIECGPGALVGGFVVISHGQSLQLQGVGRYANTARSAYLEVREYDKRLAVQEPGKGYFLWDPLEVQRTRRVLIRRQRGVGWCWEMDGKVRQPRETAQAIVSILVDRIARELRSER